MNIVAANQCECRPFVVVRCDVLFIHKIELCRHKSNIIQCYFDIDIVE